MLAWDTRSETGGDRCRFPANSSLNSERRIVLISQNGTRDRRNRLQIPSRSRLIRNDETTISCRSENGCRRLVSSAVTDLPSDRSLLTIASDSDPDHPSRFRPPTPGEPAADPLSRLSGDAEARAIAG